MRRIQTIEIARLKTAAPREMSPLMSPLPRA
jgi:hypothetical protein